MKYSIKDFKWRQICWNWKKIYRCFWGLERGSIRPNVSTKFEPNREFKKMIKNKMDEMATCIDNEGNSNFINMILLVFRLVLNQEQSPILSVKSYGTPICKTNRSRSNYPALFYNI